MGATQSVNKLMFEDMLHIIETKQYILINTMSESNQLCLIPTTVVANDETELLNNCLLKGRKDSVKIVIYGKNCNDESVYKKYTQIVSLGFTQVYVYLGGMFEWLLLQDVYTSNTFPTTTRELDLLKYKPERMLLHNN